MSLTLAAIQLHNRVIDALGPAPADISDNRPAQPPGLDKLDTVISWLLWGAGAVLFIFFIVGLVRAGKARHQGGEVDAAAPVIPLVLAVVLGGAGTIWAIVTG